jgi:flagellin-specific chaperone FliS
VNALNHALIVLGELQGVLDYERGGQVARNLSDFYTVGRVLIL